MSSTSAFTSSAGIADVVVWAQRMHARIHACTRIRRCATERHSCVYKRAHPCVHACMRALAPTRSCSAHHLAPHPPTHLRRRCCSSCRVQSTRPRIDPFPPRQHYTVLRLCATGGTDSFIGVLARTLWDLEVNNQACRDFHAGYSREDSRQRRGTTQASPPGPSAPHPAAWGVMEAE